MYFFTLLEGYSNTLVIFSDSVNIFEKLLVGPNFGCVTDIEVSHCIQGVLEPWNIVE